VILALSKIKYLAQFQARTLTVKAQATIKIRYLSGGKEISRFFFTP
jgi:hypothetical protein